jgi:putative aldouronate transport system permease protein
LLILNLGWILNAGFEVQYLLGNGIVADVSETIDIYVLKYGIRLSEYSLATAAGMFKSVVSLIMLTSTNYIAGKLGEDKLV